ncbi:MAG TPA: YiiD C-terminal domain-containing protein [Pinirhizobacter sp.]|uniref:YiiD C-terminal domain-containing protein n=1 Tax=Pinirhizobacter sp. TaxID=2950432 RepID=UPI002C8896DE|nr:YiiD C-terminal domain-containing protein [Pinirhizobacter sp.]HMH68664.1 YiiD C-terminal domain-containing protein [Pinirhizobacter sp.]
MSTEPSQHLSALLARIPLVQAMQLQLHAWDPGQLVMAAPLAPNVNDKGCAFGGSLASVMTLAGWGLVELAMHARGQDADIFVGTSTVSYLQPVWDDFQAVATLDERTDWEAFFDDWARHGHARAQVLVTVPGPGDKPAATLQARFVAKRRKA